MRKSASVIAAVVTIICLLATPAGAGPGEDNARCANNGAAHSQNAPLFCL